MIPIKLTLSGAIGIKAGLGRDRLDVDLSDIPDDALSVALKGDNGAGKSTLINLGMTPWREPPMLSGTPYEHFGETGQRELRWTHAGETYRSQISYKQTPKTKSQRAFLHILRDGDWQPVTLPDHTVSDGKASTYDTCLESILGPSDIYYLSAFRAQGASKLAEHDDPKGLMRDLLHLDEVADLAEKAKTVAREVTREHDAVKLRVERLDDHPTKIGALRDVVSALWTTKDSGVIAMDKASVKVARARAELDEAMKEGLDQQRLEDDRNAAAKRLAAVIKQTEAMVSDKQQASSAARNAITSTEQAHERMVKDIEGTIKRAEARAHGANHTLSRRQEIADAEVEATRLLATLTETEQTAEEVKATLSALVEISSKAAQTQSEIGHVEAAGKAHAVRCADLHDRAGYIDVVPCGGVAPYDECPALRNAIVAKAQIAEAEAEREAKQVLWETLRDKLTKLREQATELPAAQARSQEIDKEIRDLRAQISAATKIAAESATIKQAEAIRAEAATEIGGLSARIALEGEKHDRLMADLRAKSEEAAMQLGEAVAESHTAIAAAKAELDALPELGAGGAVERAKAALQAQIDAARKADEAVHIAAASIAETESRIGTLESELRDAAADRAEASRLADEISRWRLLAYGLAGVIDLTIEDAGPGIAAIANRLLTEAYGPRFSVQIVTQREQANGKLVECFDISVIDAETGIESSVLKKSGGESVWLDKALTDAVAIYQQEAAGVSYECLFADEAEDGLTQERKSMFYRMDRAALALGGYQRKISISHNPDAWSMADYVIDLADYKVAA